MQSNECEPSDHPSYPGLWERRTGSGGDDLRVYEDLWRVPVSLTEAQEWMMRIFEEEER